MITRPFSLNSQRSATPGSGSSVIGFLTAVSSNSARMMWILGNPCYHMRVQALGLGAVTVVKDAVTVARDHVAAARGRWCGEDHTLTDR